MASGLSSGAAYSVTVHTQPSGLTCSVANGTGTVGSANVAGVVVTCSNQSFSLGGTITGLTQSGLVLANGSDTLAVAAGATSFRMTQPEKRGEAEGIAEDARRGAEVAEQNQGERIE